MASGKCVYLYQALLDLAVGATPWTPPATMFIALSISAFDPLMTGGSLIPAEVVGAGYGRVSVSNDTTSWSTTNSTGLKYNLVKISFPHADAAWSTIKAFYLLDGNTRTASDHCLYGSDLTAMSVPAGPGPQFSVGDLKIKES